MKKMGKVGICKKKKKNRKSNPMPRLRENAMYAGERRVSATIQGTEGHGQW